MSTIREMTKADVPEVFSVRLATVENVVTIQELEDEYDLTPDTLVEAMERFLKGWVCEADGRIVGFAMGNSQTGELTVLAVLPEYEGRGIGKKLLMIVQGWLFELGHAELWLLTTPDPTLRAYGFYLSQGWIATGILVHEDEEKLVLRRP